MDCLALPSINEGSSNVILETHDCGTSVVATETGDISEITNNKNFLVENVASTLVSELSSKMSEVLIDKERRRKLHGLGRSSKIWSRSNSIKRYLIKGME